MMGIFDGLPSPGAPGQAFSAGMQRAQQEREEQESRGALSAYAVNPDDPDAFRNLARYRPDIAIQVREDQTKREQAARVAELQRNAAAGDRGAMAELAGVDLDAWDKLDDNNRAATAQRVEAIGNAALDIAARPPAERPQAWDAYIDRLSTAYPELAEFKGQYSEETLRSAIADAGKMQDFLRSQQPDYQVVPEGGTLVNTRDPAALASVASGAPGTPQQPGGAGQITFEMFQGAVNGLGADKAAAWVKRNNHIIAVSSPAQARQLPKGTRILLPDGTEGTVP